MIKAVLLLSLVDLVDVINIMIKSNPQIDIVSLAYEKEQERNIDCIIETKVPFLPYVSVKTFLRYYRDNQEINFAQYRNENFKFEELSNIKVPLFMRWGNNKELISIPANEVVSICNSKIKNENKDISFIDGATHNYMGKENILGEEILRFLKQI